MNQTQWLPGIFALAVALVGAGLYLLLGRRKTDVQPGPAKASPPDQALQAELERRAQTLLEAIRAHKESRHQHSEETYAAELRRLELEAAAALRARDEGRHRPATAPAAAPSAASGSRASAGPQGLLDRHPALKGAMWTGVVVIFFVALGLVLSQEEKARTDGMEASGRTPPSGMPQGMEHDHDGDGIPDHGDEEPPVLARALARFEANPNDLDAAGEASHFLIQLRRLDEAEKITLRGLAIDPFASELRVHRAVIRGTRGDTKGAREELQRMVDLYPGSEEGLLFLGSLSMMEGNKAEGLEYFERFALEVPANMHPPELMAALTELRNEIRGSDAPPAVE